jgi:hypothetical protein
MQPGWHAVDTGCSLDVRALMLLLMSRAVAHGLPDAVRTLYREFGPREATAVA